MPYSWFRGLQPRKVLCPPIRINTIFSVGVGLLQFLAAVVENYIRSEGIKVVVDLALEISILREICE